jgi:hypothetical protein
LGARHIWIASLCARIADAARSRVTFPALAAAWLLAGSVLTRGWIPKPAVRAIVTLGPLAVFVCFAAVLTVTMAVCLRQKRVAYASGGFRLQHALCAAGPVVLILNGLSPYLGLKTQNSFAMYSNLQTEGDQWNHLLIPRAVRIFPLQDDLVGIVSSSEPRLNRWAQSGNRAVYFQFRNDVVEYPRASVTYDLAGRRTVVAHVADDPTLSQAPNRLLRKILWFRPVPAAGNNSCLH